MSEIFASSFSPNHEHCRKAGHLYHLDSLKCYFCGHETTKEEKSKMVSLARRDDHQSRG